MSTSTAYSASSISPSKAWYLVQCKPRQDERAETHLLRQGYVCFRPQHSCERLVRKRRQILVESLFPGYLFIQLADDANWAPLRSTRGVSRVVGFGGQPLPVTDSLIAQLQQRSLVRADSLLAPGASLRILQGSFAELDSIFMSMHGDERVILLLSLLNRPQQVRLPLICIVKN